MADQQDEDVERLLDLTSVPYRLEIPKTKKGSGSSKVVKDRLNHFGKTEFRNIEN